MAKDLVSHYLENLREEYFEQRPLVLDAIPSSTMPLSKVTPKTIEQHLGQGVHLVFDIPLNFSSVVAHLPTWEKETHEIMDELSQLPVQRRRIELLPVFKPRGALGEFLTFIHPISHSILAFAAKTEKAWEPKEFIKSVEENLIKDFDEITFHGSIGKFLKNPFAPGKFHFLAFSFYSGKHDKKEHFDFKDWLERLV